MRILLFFSFVFVLILILLLALILMWETYEMAVTCWHNATACPIQNPISAF